MKSSSDESRSAGGSSFVKVRRRDPRAWDFGHIWLVPDLEDSPIWDRDEDDGAQFGPFFSLDEVEEYLDDLPERGG